MAEEASKQEEQQAHVDFEILEEPQTTRRCFEQIVEVAAAALAAAYANGVEEKFAGVEAEERIEVGVAAGSHCWVEQASEDGVVDRGKIALADGMGNAVEEASVQSAVVAGDAGHGGSGAIAEEASFDRTAWLGGYWNPACCLFVADQIIRLIAACLYQFVAFPTFDLVVANHHLLR